MPLTLRTFALESAAMVGGLVATGILLRRLTGDDPPEDRAIRSLQESFGHSPDDGAQPRTERSVGARVGPDDGPQPRTDSSAPAGASGVVVEERAAADHPAPAGTGGVVAGREAELVDGLTHGLSWYSGVPQTIANGAAWCGVTWLATRDWRQSIAPGAALALETACFVGSAA
ncbi:MAG TPA: hypothetical protein GX743_06755, partial [Actinomycetales bacterium]|nr:hypothetical protein [Actinomycetales bacterium]